MLIRSLARRRAFCTALVACLLSLTVTEGALAAEPAPSRDIKDVATARKLHNEGRAQRKANDLQGALASFRAADAIMHVPTTSLDLGTTELALGMLVEASESLQRTIRWTGVSSKPFADAQR